MGSPARPWKRRPSGIPAPCLGDRTAHGDRDGLATGILLAVAPDVNRRCTVLPLLGSIALAACSEPAPAGGTGTVEGTILDLSTAISERVVKLEVEEGDPVAAGRVLVRLDCRRLETRRDGLQARLEAADAELAAASARARAARERAESMRLRVAATAAESEALTAEEAVATRDASRVDRMGRYAAESERDRAETRAETLQHRVVAARRQSAATRQEARAAAAEADAAEAQRQAAERAKKTLVAERRRLEVELEECAIEAPRSGFVEELFYDEGEMALAGAPLVRVVDLADLWVTFYLPNDQLGNLTVGKEAEVVADAYPDRTFVGRVATIATEAEFTPRNIQTREDRTRLVYPVEVRLPNPDHALRPGMPVEVRIRAGGGDAR